MSSSHPDTTYVRRPELNAVEMDGELVMMGQEQGEYYGLRDVAASLWKHLEAPKSLEELVILVSAEYDVTPETCRDDIVAFLDDLVGRELVTVS
ncbi:MAG: PqqD family peptide modification chaperone [Propionibacteriales bacterium]|nr:PqqD family peptide modification chaperone [Propionibacteriales bacterium]